mmetsp:Transcript_53139/g.99614  ORF Transcript_53139/g.99614 Transcript_53139/m.99614 type:complete len:247 (+) Transcript_53139:131-871(+)
MPRLSKLSWLMAALLRQQAAGVEVSNQQAWVSIDRSGDVARPQSYGFRSGAAAGHWESDKKMMRRSSDSDGTFGEAAVRKPQPSLEASLLRELMYEESRYADFSNASLEGPADARWGSAVIQRGPAGPKGDKGPKGDAGKKGAIGPAGKKGAKGAQGEKGPQGEQGPMQDMKPVPENLASVGMVGALIVFNLISAGIVYTVVSGKLNEKGGAAGKSADDPVEAAPEEAYAEEQYPEETEEEGQAYK